MNLEHKKILKAIKTHQGKGTQHTKNDSYILSGHKYYDVSVPVRRQIIKDWMKDNKDISFKDFVALVDSLILSDSHEEKTVASYLLGYKPDFRKQIKTKQLDKWLDHLVGWAEIDAFCTVYTKDNLLDSWKEWESFIKKLAKDKNINKRRAALVFLVVPARKSSDKKIQELSFEIIDKLKSETQIIITKAISWLLREMTYCYKKEVRDYLKKNEDSLPKIALRETKRKIETGRK